MKKTFNHLFLPRIYHQNRPLFYLICIYMLMYTISFVKEMDMLAFPYNAMFAGASTQKPDDYVYIVQHNGKTVFFTHFSYWKKDLLEQTSFHYARYIQNGLRVYTDDYLDQKNWPMTWKVYLRNRLTPGKVKFSIWAKWYLNQAGVSYHTNDQVRLLRSAVEQKGDSIFVKNTALLCSAFLY